MLVCLFMRLAVLSAAFSMVVLTAACAKDEAPETKGIADPLVFKTTKETYLTGPEFCSFYSKITQNETGLRVSVPKDYDHPELGSLSIYAYTTKPFDASLPSYIYFDGGPGQNTHGLMFDFFGTTMNEIRFDQRGLGCSAPLTWEEYTDATLYSSRNNIRDADEIRKAYGIAKWTVYGVSYGTVPATMYGSKFASVTTSVVLEGVVGDTAMLGDATYKAGKLNLVLALLTPAQRDGFALLIQEQDESGNRTADSEAFRALMMRYFYIDKGMSKFAEQVNAYVAADGTILRAKLADLRSRMNNRAR